MIIIESSRIFLAKLATKANNNPLQFKDFYLNLEFEGFSLEYLYNFPQMQKPTRY